MCAELFRWWITQRNSYRLVVDMAGARRWSKAPATTPILQIHRVLVIFRAKTFTQFYRKINERFTKEKVYF
jgi:hypothetical protein